MADDTTPAPPIETADAEASQDKLEQTVEVTDIGPCKKHIKVVVDRKAIDARFNEKYTELVRSTSQVNGFRPGKAPRKVIERRFKSAVEEQVRQEVLMASLEQLATENQIAPLAPPDLDINKLEIPDEGPFVYEFDIEVRPEFTLPEYKGIKLKRPVKTFSAKDVERERRRLFEPAGSLVPKNGPIEMNDVLIADIEFRHEDKVLNEIKEARVRVEKELVLKDAVASDFGKLIVGAQAGDVRDVPIKLADGLSDANLRGQVVNARFTIKDVKMIRLPELTPQILEHFGVRNTDQLDELIELALNQRLEYLQRQSYRRQILATIADASQWELPRDMLIRQARRALAKRIMEMRSAGMSEEEIAGRQRVLEQDVIQNTAITLREHFVMQKIAEIEKIEIQDEDIEAEIERIADRSGESPRRVRARMEKEDMIDALAAELLERRALDLVLQNAEYEDVPLTSEDEESEVATVAGEVVPGATVEPSPEDENANA